MYTSSIVSRGEEVKWRSNGMSLICPAILASDGPEYARQIDRISGFAKRIQIDLMDGKFADSQSIDLQDAWWPDSIEADVHLMYRTPEDHIETLVKLKPNMAIIHAEAPVDHKYFAAKMHVDGIKAGLAVLPETPISLVEKFINDFDHLLIFSGNLGHFGGKAELSLVQKVKEIKQYRPDIEIGWDGGVNIHNAQYIASHGVDVLNVGGFIQNASDPKQAYENLLYEITQKP